MHFTYDTPNRTTLAQGDIIRRTSKVDELLQEVHPHYHRAADYKYLSILTQSCDLVKSAERRPTRYISLAAVRPLDSVLRREVESLQYDEVERKLGFCNQARQEKLVQFMQRLLNNNEPRYFYYHREPNHSFDDDCCAFLQLSVAVKAELHYDTLLEAKLLQLKEAFQHKLGNLVGTMYSRVGTEDWLPHQCNRERWEALTRQPLQDEKLVLWLERDIHDKVLRELKKLPEESWTDEQFEMAVTKFSKDKEQRRREMLETIAASLKQFSIDDETISSVTRHLDGNSDFRKRVK